MELNAFGMIRAISTLVFAAMTAVTGFGQTETPKQEPPVRLPEMTVVAEPLNMFPPFPQADLTAADFSNKSAPLDAQFPGQAYYDGISKGAATMGVMVDANGRPTDFLLIRYTQPYFGASLMRAARQQQYVARRIKGIAVPGPFNFTYNFEPLSKVVTMLSFDAVTQRDEQVGGGLRFVYAPHLEEEIDGGRLEATRLTVPVLPSDYAAESPRAPRVLVKFYVDENGHVRLPSVESAPSAALVARAIAAVQRWEFNPPKLKGQGVLVYTARAVTFRPAR